jgi:SulP family sulfate permease
MEAVSIAKAIQAKHKGEYEIDANQELIGLGLGNVIGSFFGSFPTTGGFSRSAVNEQAGAKTNLAAIISASLIALTLLFLTPLFYHLPKSILASIIMVAVFGLIDIKYPIFLWRTRKEDFIMLLIAFLVTLGVGIKEGIGFSVIISLIAMIYRTTKPHYAILGRFPDSKVFRNIERYDNLIIRDDILAIRYDSNLHFANTSHFIDSVKKHVKLKGDTLRLVILQANSISHIDSTAYLALTDLIEELEEQNIKVYFSNLIGPTRDFLERSGIDDVGEKEKTFVDVDTAIAFYDTNHAEQKS